MKLTVIPTATIDYNYLISLYRDMVDCESYAEAEHVAQTNATARQLMGAIEHHIGPELYEQIEPVIDQLQTAWECVGFANGYRHATGLRLVVGGAKI